MFLNFKDYQYLFKFFEINKGRYDNFMKNISVVLDDFGYESNPQPLRVNTVQAGRYDGVADADVIFTQHEVQTAAIR